MKLNKVENKLGMTRDKRKTDYLYPQKCTIKT